MSKWIKISEKHPPFMKTVDVVWKGKVIIAHRESQDDEDFSMYSMETRSWVSPKLWKERPKPPKSSS